MQIKHFSPQQRVWHTERARAGGTTYVFLQVGREYLLFLGIDAAKELGRVDQARLYEIAKCVWTNGLDDASFRTNVSPTDLS